MARPLRRHARFRVFLSFGTQEVEGATSNISMKGMYVRIPYERLKNQKVHVGTQLNVSFLLPGQSENIRCLAELVWKNPNDIDARGKKSLGMGLYLIDVSHQMKKNLNEFIDNFRYTVLLADKNVDNIAFVRNAIGKEYNLVKRTSSDDVVEFLEQEDVSVVVAGNIIQDMSGSNLLILLKEKLPHLRTERILLVDSSSEGTDIFTNAKEIFEKVKMPVTGDHFRRLLWHAVDRYAMRAEIDRLNSELERRIRVLEVEAEKLKRENIYLNKRVEGPGKFSHIIGSSDILRTALAQAEQVVSTDVRVYIHGETGTGKEILARSIHERSSRADKPFLAVNCAEIPETLLQSTFFGHLKGAFTGATRNSPGVLRAANGGTVLLDEVSELHHSFQLSLLRVLQEGEILPVGSSRKVKVDVRFISCCNKNLLKEVEAERFRKDLYYRLVVVHLEMPSLRRRREDVPMLVQHFLDLFCARHGKHLPGLTVGAMSALEAYDWPGNIRELENEVERLVVSVQEGKPISLKHVSPHIRENIPINISSAGDRFSRVSFGEMCRHVLKRITDGNISLNHAIEEVEYKVMLEALKSSNGNQSDAAKLLKIPRTTLRSRMDKKSIRKSGDENSSDSYG